MVVELRCKDELQSIAKFGGSGGKDKGWFVTISYIADPKEITIKDAWQWRQCILSVLCRIIKVGRCTQTCPFWNFTSYFYRIRESKTATIKVVFYVSIFLTLKNSWFSLFFSEGSREVWSSQVQAVVWHAWYHYSVFQGLVRAQERSDRKVAGATFPLLSLPGYSCDSLTFRWSDPSLFSSSLHSSRTYALFCSASPGGDKRVVSRDAGWWCTGKTNLQDVVL